MPSSKTAGLLSASHGAEVREALEAHGPLGKASAALALLYLAQTAYGRLTSDAVAEVADLLGVSPTDVRALVGFYSLLEAGPHGDYVIHVCTDLPCALRGAGELLEHVCRAFGVEVGGTSADGLFTLRTAKCLAACDRAPVMQVNLAYFYDLTAERIDELVARLRQAAEGGASRVPPYGLEPTGGESGSP